MQNLTYQVNIPVRRRWAWTDCFGNAAPFEDIFWKKDISTIS